MLLFILSRARCTYLAADARPMPQCHVAHIVVQRSLLPQLANLRKEVAREHHGEHAYGHMSFARVCVEHAPLTCSSVSLRAPIAVHSCCIVSGQCCSCVKSERTSCSSSAQRAGAKGAASGADEDAHEDEVAPAAATAAAGCASHWMLCRGADESAWMRCCTAWSRSGSCSAEHENGRHRAAPLASLRTKRSAHWSRRGGAAPRPAALLPLLLPQARAAAGAAAGDSVCRHDESADSDAAGRTALVQGRAASVLGARADSATCAASHGRDTQARRVDHEASVCRHAAMGPNNPNLAGSGVLELCSPRQARCGSQGAARGTAAAVGDARREDVTAAASAAVAQPAVAPVTVATATVGAAAALAAAACAPSPPAGSPPCICVCGSTRVRLRFLRRSRSARLSSASRSSGGLASSASSCAAVRRGRISLPLSFRLRYAA